MRLIQASDTQSKKTRTHLLCINFHQQTSIAETTFEVPGAYHGLTLGPCPRLYDRSIWTYFAVKSQTPLYNMHTFSNNCGFTEYRTMSTEERLTILRNRRTLRGQIPSRCIRASTDLKATSAPMHVVVRSIRSWPALHSDPPASS